MPNDRTLAEVEHELAIEKLMVRNYKQAAELAQARYIRAEAEIAPLKETIRRYQASNEIRLASGRGLRLGVALLDAKAERDAARAELQALQSRLSRTALA